MGLDLPLTELDQRLLVVDGNIGELIIEPNPSVLEEYQQLIRQARNNFV